ncbi:MAG: hypothetical protein LCH35_09765 [Bacteroidetes bacterium]|uniref:hypothetical protein n=1 Tax=Flavobacterium sp. TaxID=239 RepID=UPI002FD8CA4E|nr:hypothetical protein [Bacteroidota bacterium]
MKKYRLLVIVFFVGCIGYGQGEENFAPDLNVKTPEVSSMLKFLETPVSYNTGLPNISVPIYTIKQGDISYPISIDYNASGVNVNERAGWVGMGFCISQPQVTRMIKGIADDQGGFLTENDFKVASGQVEALWNSAYFSSVAGDLDLESDEYRVMLPNGESICFYFNQERSIAFPYGEIIQVPITNNKITPLFSGNRIIGWEVFADNGFIYTYSLGNSTILTQSYTVTDNLPTLDGRSTTGTYLTSWMLSEIKSPTNNSLYFQYASFQYTDCNLVGQRRDVARDMSNQDVGSPLDSNIQTNYQKTIGINYFLESIWGDFGKVDFTLDTNLREDYTFGKKLDAITIYDKNIHKVNRYAFEYVYKTSPNPTGIIYTCGYQHPNSDLTKRLFLDKVIILGNVDNTTTNKPFYRFVYNPIELPHRFSYATDWWGYYNGALENPSLVPTRFRHDPAMPERNVNSAYSQAGLLTEVFYPTGGSTQYEYESNRGINDKPLVKHVFIYGGNVFESGYFDGINIIPSVKTNVSFDTLDLTPVSDESVSGGGRKLIYEMPFTIGENAIGYYYGLLNTTPFTNNNGLPFTINLPVNVKRNCNTCIYGDDSLPDDNGCSIYYRILKNDEIVINNVLISGNQENNFEVQLGTVENDGLHITSQNYKLVIEVFTGHQTPLNEQLFNYNNSNPTDNVHIEFEWDVYNPSIVNKINGFKYDMPLGGHRIKKIKTLENPNAIPLEKRYEYKDENDIESGVFNFRLSNFFRFANTYYLNSDNYYPLQFYHGQSIGYSFVTEKNISDGEEKKVTYKYNYFTNPDPNNSGACYLFNGSYGHGIYPCIDDPDNGLLIENKIGDEKKIETFYTSPNPLLNTKFVIGFNTANRVEADEEVPDSEVNYTFGKYRISSFHKRKVSGSLISEYFSNGTVTTTTTNEYDTTNTLELASQITTNSSGEETKIKYYYPQDTEMTSSPNAQALVNKNMITTPLKTQTLKNATILSEQNTTYHDWGSGLLLPQTIETKKGSNGSETRFVYDSYDIYGNPLCFKNTNGMYVSYIWGYQHSQPIAKIENAQYNSINPSLISLAQSASNTSVTGTETNLLSALSNLRNSLPNAIITTYTYKPLIGVSTITDPKGYIMYYDYDSFGRLNQVKDAEGKILSKSEYHYKTQE